MKSAVDAHATAAGAATRTNARSDSSETTSRGTRVRTTANHWDNTTTVRGRDAMALRHERTIGTSRTRARVEVRSLFRPRRNARKRPSTAAIQMHGTLAVHGTAPAALSTPTAIGSPSPGITTPISSADSATTSAVATSSITSPGPDERMSTSTRNLRLLRAQNDHCGRHRPA